MGKKSSFRAAVFLVVVASGVAPADKLAATPVAAVDRPECTDQAAAVLPGVEKLVSRFKEEATIAFSTPRISLAAEISTLRGIQRETLELAGWPEDICELRLREKLDAAESFEIQRLVKFLANAGRSGAREAEDLWADADRQLKALRELVEATRRD